MEKPIETDDYGGTAPWIERKEAFFQEQTSTDEHPQRTLFQS